MNVGCAPVEAFDEVQGVRIPAHVLYPSRAPEAPTRFGPYTLDVALNGAVDGERLPLIVISHGNGGSPWTYRLMAAHLARQGFVVALPEHPGNSRADNSLTNTAANLGNRPRHLRRVNEAIRAKFPVREKLGVIGHSIGAYTALALAGGRPTAFAWETADRVPTPIEVEADRSVAALVLFAPAAMWLQAPGALSDVTAPILMLSGEKDELAPLYHADVVKHGVRGPMDHRIVPGAGHFSFQSPFPPEMVRPDFPPAHDPPGFDRAGWQPALAAQVKSFLCTHL